MGPVSSASFGLLSAAVAPPQHSASEYAWVYTAIAVATYLWCWLLLIAHELGHALAGILVGLRPFEVCLGCVRAAPGAWKIAGISFSFGWNPFVGHVRCIARVGRLYNWRCLIFTLGGIAASVGMLYVAWSLAALPRGKDFAGFMHYGSKHYANFALLFLAGNLWPTDVRYRGVTVSTDGLQIIRYLIVGVKDIAFHHPIWRAVSLVKRGRRDEAVAYLYETLASPDICRRAQVPCDLANYLATLGEIDGAIAALRPLLATPSLRKSEESLIPDMFASLILFHDKGELLDEAIKVLRDELEKFPARSTLKGTLGGLLFAQCRLDEARIFLEANYRECSAPTDRGISSAYLAYYALTGGNREAALNYAREAREKLPGHILVERILAKLGLAAELPPIPEAPFAGVQG